MKTKAKLLSYALIVVFLLSVVAGGPIPGPLGVDVVTAASGEAAQPAKPAPKTPATQTTTQTTAEITRVLALGAKGSDVKLLQTMLNNNGYKLKADGIFGKQTLLAVKDYQAKNGLEVTGKVGPETLAKLNPPKTTAVKLGRAEYAAHGTKCFTLAAVVMAGDKIVAAALDDYQFMAKDTSIAVPNSDKDFGTYYKDPAKVLASKRANAAAYSANMAKNGGATISIDKNLDAIQAYVVGKTVAELEATLVKNDAKQMVDAVSGATLVDTKGYVTAIVAAAKAAKEVGNVQIEIAALKDIKLMKAEYAAHGTKCFTVPVVAMLGDKIIAASLDDYQFMAKDTSVAVPNSDKDFGQNYKDPARVLASKRANAAAYSANMAKNGGATKSIDVNLDAIQAYVAGKTVSELEEMLSKNDAKQMVDAVSGATLVDTKGYVTAIVAAAKGIKEEKVALKLGRIEYAAHGTKCFTVPVVLLAGDKIVAASLDEYQFMAKDGSIAVPNSDKDFGQGYKDETKVLASKRANAAAYSANMAKNGGATIPIDKNLDAVQAYVIGKTVAELEATLAKNDAKQMVDAVSGATLVDTKGYVTAIVEAAKAAKEIGSIQINPAAVNTYKVGRVEYAAHGTKCFTVPVVVMLGERIVAASLDDYQFMAKDSSTAVPNSDKDFGQGYKDPTKVLASKRANAAAYSANMSKNGGATKAIDVNLDIIQKYVTGKTIVELEEMLSKNDAKQMVDAVSGATLVDTKGYVSAIVAAAKAAK